MLKQCTKKLGLKVTVETKTSTKDDGIVYHKVKRRNRKCKNRRQNNNLVKAKKQKNEVVKIMK